MSLDCDISACPLVLGWYAVDMFCWILNLLQDSLATLEVNHILQSEMNFFDALYLAKTCCRINTATPSAIIDSLQGMRNIALEKLWSVIVRLISYPPDWGNFMMKLMVIVWKGSECLGGNRNHSWFEGSSVDFTFLASGTTLNILLNILFHVKPPEVSFGQGIGICNSWVSVLHQGRDVHLTWVKSFTKTLSERFCCFEY